MGDKNVKKRFKVIAGIVIVFGILIPMQLAAAPSFIGNVIGSSVPSNFADYWNQVTSENAAKWGSAESSRDSINWGSIDSHYDYAKGRGYPYKFHCLVWGSQEPGWVSGLSSSEQVAEVEEWIQAVGQRYSGIDYIDVVNEPLHAPPSYKNAIGGDGSTGWDWVIWAFEKAQQYCSGRRILNDYSILNSDSNTSSYIEIINLLKSRGLIDGIGVQGHGFESSSISTIRGNLDRLAGTGVSIYVSEYEVERSDDNQQLQIYQEQFPEFYNHSDVGGITLWGYIQGQIWKSNAWLVSSGSSGANERPAMQWLRQNYLGGSGPTSPPSETPYITQPPAETPEPTTIPGDVDCSNVPAWDAETIYDTAGMRVVYNGNLYENNWYSQGQNPEENSGTNMVWTLLGRCGPGGLTAPPSTNPPTAAPTEPSQTDLGDVNSDGSINIVDALLVAQYAVGLNPSGFDVSRADTNCDGSVNIVDALLIAQYAVGLINQFC
jgi:endo-1,4-beta-xylanase